MAEAFASRRLARREFLERREAHKSRHRRQKGYIELSYYNIFWIFVLCSFIGLVSEDVFHFIAYGNWQDRSGMVWGPFSPIYGFGGLLMTVSLNRFWNKNVLLIFLISLAIGMGFEWVTSWYLETFFNVVAWDYSGTIGSIGGRTNLAFGLMWGTLGLAWVRLILPWILRVIEIIPINLRTIVTVVASTIIILDGALTIGSLNRQYQRNVNIPSNSVLDDFFDMFFPSSFMTTRFPTMDFSGGVHTIRADGTARLLSRDLLAGSDELSGKDGGAEGERGNFSSPYFVIFDDQYRLSDGILVLVS
jgi:uncharacterized membrane protein